MAISASRIRTVHGRLGAEAFQAEVRGFLASRWKWGQSGGAAIEAFLREQVDGRDHPEARDLATEVLAELLAAQAPRVTPTPAQRRAIAAGRAAIARGDCVTLDEAEAYVAGHRAERRQGRRHKV